MPIRNPPPFCYSIKPACWYCLWGYRRLTSQLYIPPFILLEDHDNNKQKITCFSHLILSPPLIKKSEACSAVSHQKNDLLLCDTNVLLCASASSILSDPVILIAYPQTQRGKKKINSTALFLHPHLMPYIKRISPLTSMWSRHSFTQYHEREYINSLISRTTFYVKTKRAESKE